MKLPSSGLTLMMEVANTSETSVNFLDYTVKHARRKHLL
jgi:hypothetical protein